MAYKKSWMEPGLIALAALTLMAVVGALRQRGIGRSPETPVEPVVENWFGPYRLEEVLAQSPYSTTYRAVSSRPAVLRIIQPLAADPGAFRRRLLRSLRLTEKIETDLVAPVLDWGERDGQLYVARDDLGGTALSPSPGGPPGELLRPLPALMRELDGLHRRNLVHGNLKTSKLRLDECGRARLTDFGLVAGPGYGAVTGSGRWLGTPAYLAPEQLQKDEVDGQADQYALGVVLYELLTGTLPFTGPNDTGVMLRKQVEEPPPLRSCRPELSPELEQVVHRMLEPDPAARFPDLSEAAEALERCLRPGAASGG